MEVVTVFLIGAVAAGYIIWNFSKTVRGRDSCSPGGCSGCNCRCGKVFVPTSKQTEKEPAKVLPN